MGEDSRLVSRVETLESVLHEEILNVPYSEVELENERGFRETSRVKDEKTSDERMKPLELPPNPSTLRNLNKRCSSFLKDAKGLHQMYLLHEHLTRYFAIQNF